MIPAGSKRKSSAGGLTKQQIAAIAGARTAAKFPYAKFGRMHLPRGTDAGIARYGVSWYGANAEQRANRARDGYSGRGLYTGRGGYIQDIGRFLGGGIGGLLGNKERGKMIGGMLGKGAEFLTGRGLYTGRGSYVSEDQSNEVISGSNRTSASFSSVPDESGSVIVSNREYVGDIFAPATSGTFNLQNFPLNPGLEQTFPWLAQTAANYEEYEFIQLVFEFKSTVQDVNSSNGQVGTIILTTNYNASQPLFSDKPSMISYYGSVSGKSTDNLFGGVECDPKKLSGTVGSYVRTNPVLVGEDLKTYDHGNFQLATHNIPTGMLNGTLGELYVVYQVKLRKPRFLTARGLAISRYLTVSGEAETYNNMMGTLSSVLYGQQNNLPVLLSIPGVNTIRLVFPAYYSGSLEVKFLMEGTGLTYTAFNAPQLVGNVNAIEDIYASNFSSITDTPRWVSLSSEPLGMILIIHIRVSTATNGGDNFINIFTNATAGTVRQTSIDVCEYNTSFNGPSGAPTLVNKSGAVVVPGP